MALGRDASLTFGEVGLGGSLGRLDLGVDLIGDGSHSEMVGIYFGDGDQVLDYRVVVNHHGKNTSSDVFLKGAVEDKSESVFTGSAEDLAGCHQHLDLRAESQPRALRWRQSPLGPQSRDPLR